MEPLSEKRYLELHAPAGGDFLAARERLLAALPDGCRLTLGCLQQLYPVLSAADYRVTVTLCPGPGGTDAVRVEPGDTTAEHYGLCLDIGSTIMQMELVDLVRGRTLSQAACTNSQTQFGANILDRILAVKADRENLKTLQALTLSDVRGMIDTCCRAADIRPEAISAMTVGGNTTMLHFFLGCDPWLVFQSPYTPVFFDPGVIRAAELGLPICGNVYCMPAIANYLGGDITGGLRRRIWTRGRIWRCFSTSARTASWCWAAGTFCSWARARPGPRWRARSAIPACGRSRGRSAA